MMCCYVVFVLLRCVRCVVVSVWCCVCLMGLGLSRLFLFVLCCCVVALWFELLLFCFVLCVFCFVWLCVELCRALLCCVVMC